jgi:hypothetical protein
MQFYTMEEMKGKITMVLRTADYYESCGQFATVNFRAKGERYREFYQDFYRFYCERRREWLPIVNLSGIEWYKGGECYAKLLGAKICNRNGGES